MANPSKTLKKSTTALATSHLFRPIELLGRPLSNAEQWPLTVQRAIALVKAMGASLLYIWPTKRLRRFASIRLDSGYHPRLDGRVVGGPTRPVIHYGPRGLHHRLDSVELSRRDTGDVFTQQARHPPAY